MPRGRSNSNSSRSSYGSRNNSRQQQQTQPTPAAQQQLPAQQQGGMMSGIGSTIMTGMAFGAGSEIAHQAVRGLMGGSGHDKQASSLSSSSSNVNEEEVKKGEKGEKVNPCMTYNNKFIECLKGNGNDISSCQNYFDDLKMCEKSMI